MSSVGLSHPQKIQKKSSHKRYYLLISTNSLGLDSTSFRWHACVQQTQHCALWLWCVLFRPPLVASLFPPDVTLSLSLSVSAGVVEELYKNRHKSVSFAAAFPSLSERTYYLHSWSCHHLRCDWVGNPPPAVVAVRVGGTSLSSKPPFEKTRFPVLTWGEKEKRPIRQLTKYFHAD